MVLLLALIALLLISAVGASILFMTAAESSLVRYQRSTTRAYTAGLGGLEEARARLSVSDPTFLGDPTTSTITFPSAPGEVLYILNPDPPGEFILANVTTPGNPYYDWEYDREWCPLGAAPCGALAAATVQSLPSDLATLGGLVPPTPYKWARITILTEEAAKRDINGDGALDNAIPVFYDATTNRQNVANQGTGFVFRITALAALPDGTSRILQYDAGPGSPLPPFPAALTVCGPSLTFNAPNSNNWVAQGEDTTVPPAPPVEGFGTCSPQSTTDAVNSIPANRLDHYTGASGLVPDVVNVSATMDPCLLSVQCLEDLVTTLTANADQVFAGPIADPSIGNDTSPLITVIQGDVTFNGFTRGAGILVVTGSVLFAGNSGFNGVLLAVGQGSVDYNGGGNGAFNGAVFVAKTRDANGNILPTLGQPFIDWNGGGGNGIRFSSMWINTMAARFPYRILSFRDMSQ